MCVIMKQQYDKSIFVIPRRNKMKKEFTLVLGIEKMQIVIAKEGLLLMNQLSLVAAY